MNKLIFLLLFILTITSASAQKWFSTDDSWTYNIIGTWVQGYSQMTVVDTLTINQKSAFRLENVANILTNNMPRTFENEFICYEEENQVFCLDNYGTFQLLYDFNLQVGDSIFYTVNNSSNSCSNLIKYHLDSLSTIEVGGEVLSVQHFTYSDNETTLSASTRVIEKIGFVDTEFGDIATRHSCTLDIHGFLLCSYSNGEGSLEFRQGCEALVSTNDLISNNITIYPNPASDKINIDIKGQLDYKVNLYDKEGKLIIESSNSLYLEVASIPMGSYLLEIIDMNSYQRFMERIVVVR